MSDFSTPGSPETEISKANQTQSTVSSKLNNDSSVSNSESSSDTKSKTGAEELRTICASFDDDLESYEMFTNGECLMINFFLFPKYIKQRSDLNVENTLHLKYKTDVLFLQIDDDLNNFGYNGYFIVNDVNGNLLTCFNQYYSYFLSINITTKINVSDDEYRTVKYEPYICEISNVTPIEQRNLTYKTYRIDFKDILSSIANQVGFPTAFRFFPSLKDASTFESGYTMLLQHIFNYTSSLYEGIAIYSKDIKYDWVGNDGGKAKSLWSGTCQSIQAEDSILEALETISKNSVTGMDDFQKYFNTSLTKQKIASLGENTNVLFPLFCREEYDDPYGYYEKYFTSQQNVSEQIELNSNNTINDKRNYIYRSYTFRNFAQPFLLAFGGSSESQLAGNIIWESINPFTDSEGNYTEEELNFETMMGRTQTPIMNYTVHSIDVEEIKNKWKNVLFFSESENSSSSELVLFDWIFKYWYEIVLKLNNKTTLLNGKTANFFTGIIPSFYAKYLTTYSEYVSYNTASNSKNDNTQNSEIQSAADDFNFYNANCYTFKTEDVDAEKMLLVGKMMASFVLLNTSFSFDIKGSLIRRPNEIIKITKNVDLENSDSNENQNIYTTMFGANYTLLYISSVSHIFNGTDFVDRLYTHKIYEVC